MSKGLLLDDETEICIDNLVWDYRTYCDNPNYETEAKLDASRHALRACFGEYDRLFVEWEAANDWQRERPALLLEVERLRRFERYVCEVIAMGNQADLTVEALPI